MTGDASIQPVAIDRGLIGLLGAMVTGEASDLHLVAGHRATYRVHGRIGWAAGDIINDETCTRMIETALPPAVRGRMKELLNLDCSLAVEINGAPHRFRVNAFISQGRLAACFRHIPDTIPTFEWLGFPADLAKRIAGVSNGLVVITGITGSGKSTTLATIVEHINREGGSRIITVEEPIEYVYSRNDRTVITQREVGSDVASFYDGLKSGLRQDPDVILLGEIRDRETAQMALSAAETGHLILTTMHTRDAKGAITRFVDLFPHEAQDDVRTQLSLSLRFVVAQHLLPHREPNHKRVLALELLVANHPIRAAIRQGKIENIETAIQTGRKDGMVSLDENLTHLVHAGKITAEIARRHAKDPAGLQVLPPN